jgi:hypothetical protein
MRPARVRNAVAWRLAEARAIAGHADLVRPGAAFAYAGWAGEGNLGDDLMLEAHRALLAPLRVALLPRARVAERLAVLRAAPGGLKPGAVLLGGGTLFGRADWWQRVEAVRAALPAAPWSALGVGVEDDAFVSDRSFTRGEAMRRWAQFAGGWPVLGVRGPRSLEILESYGVPAEVTGDPALALAAQAPPAAMQERLLGVSVAVPEARWGDAGTAAATVEDALAGLRRAGWRFRLFAFSKWDRDRTADLARRLGDSAHVRKPDTTVALLRDLGECHVVLGERLHAVVMAVAAGTPSVAAEYRPKLRDFMRSIDREELTVRVDRSGARALRDLVLSVADRREDESRRLARAVGELTPRLEDAARRACLVLERRPHAGA